MGEIVTALLRGEQIEGGTDAVIECRDRAFLGLSQVSLEFGEDLLDRIEVWAVGGLVTQFCAGRFDDLADRLDLVSR